MVLTLKRLAVTGASGMVGRHTLSFLDDIGVPYIAVSRTAPPARSAWRRWDLTDWRDPEQFDQLFGTVDGLLHIGAAVPRSDLKLGPKELFDANVRSCLALASWAVERHIPTVFLSGAIVYADCAAHGISEDAPRAANPEGDLYGFSKVLAEQIFERFGEIGLRVTILRATSIYGDGLAAGKMVTSFLDTCRKDGLIKLVQPVDDRVNLVNARDVAEALVSALQHEARGIFNIAGPRLLTVQEIADACVTACGKGSVRVSRQTADSKPRSRFDLDCRKAKHIFGFAPKIDLPEGLSRMLAASAPSDPPNSV